MELTAEEINLIEKRRQNKNIESQAPAGIGTSRIWAYAKLKNKKFIDECTIIEREGQSA